MHQVRDLLGEEIRRAPTGATFRVHRRESPA